ncbi:hypothetical protein, partial [Brevundimonas sp. ZS04]|uniref:hypothetical protein n=1 Tax=Brevundimonas sp. ZS04 TaxID=1906854 RepID=UPI001E4C20AD
MEPQQAPAGRRGVSPPAILGLILLTATLAASGFLGWQVFGTTWLARSAAAESVAQLRDQWATATPVPSAEEGRPPAEPVPAPGEIAWILRIPALGLEWPVAAGVDEDVLARAVGWY